MTDPDTPTDSDAAARLPSKCPTCGSENPTTYYGSCFDNQHSTIFDPRLPLDPWHAYMTDLRLLRRDMDNLNAYVKAGREARERVEAERDAAVARADKLETAIGKHLNDHVDERGEQFGCCNDDEALWSAAFDRGTDR